ncbi:MAG: bifunctional UDP-N-acetylmuramoyl-tripeptide:D-alanyl-D-alanine ligase/alanine racemase [Chitinophagaceae bacterium]|nr:bifunctional UDP-N-acetylmuramoyl-tripeptide:D-alanyl-D-alanine ligase/alanine racemase [Chitinophagaceae bacterium]
MLKTIPATEQKKDIQTVCLWAQGTWLQQCGNNNIEELCIDSRKIAHPETALFIAITTRHRDGHSFIGSAYDKGVRNFLVTTDVDTGAYPDANFIKVKDTVAALQQIATANRKRYDIPCIGITGSNGKTIIKEWLYQLLSADYNTVRSPKSYNSQIGVPMSVWMMDKQHQLAIFEAGISQPGEMEKLERIIHPTIGVFTNIGEAHSEGFLNNRQKIKEKLLLFRYAKHLVYCKDHQELNQSIVEYLHQVRNEDEKDNIQPFKWSYKNDADLHIIAVNKDNGSTTIEARYNSTDISITIPFSDPASIENAIHCWCVLLLMRVPQEKITERMLHLAPVSMRLELKHGINDCTFINDTYNSDLTSLLIALEYLEQQRQHQHHTVILSDMLQIARPDGELYEEVADILGSKHIQRFIGIGPALYKNKAPFRKHKRMRSIFFKSTDDFLKNFHLITFNNEAILLKGARMFKFERISTLLEQKIHQTVMSINLSSLTHNLNVFRRRLKPGVKTMAMVKAFSYGSGSYEIAHRLQYAGVDYLAVAYTDEGIALRKGGITMPIMVMSPDTQTFDRMIAWKLEPEIFNMRSLQAFLQIAQTLHIEQYPVHIKLDTGMHRLGFNPDEIGELTNTIKDNELLKVVSIFSHLAASEDPKEDNFTRGQAEKFEAMCAEINKALTYKPVRHICNSAAIARHPEMHYEMVRLGLGLYGIDSSGDLQKELQQIGTLRTTIAQIRTVPAGEGISYGHTDAADWERRIATISIGYADGYPRAMSNGESYVLIHGKKAKITGKVCMDMCMVDVTSMPEAREGDDVIIFNDELSVTQLAAWAGTITYELMTGISQRVKRVYENEI